MTDYPTFKDAVDKGLFHPNCRHSTSLYQEGVTQIPQDTEDPQGDKDRQELRSLERRVREWKRREAAAMTPADKAKAKAQVRAYQAKIRHHTATTTAKRQPHREQLPKAEREPLPAKPVVPPKPVEPETFLTRHRDVAARLPANRFDLGVHREKQSLEAERAARVAYVTKNAGGTLAELDEKIAAGQLNVKRMDDLLRDFQGPPGSDGFELGFAKKWPEGPIKDRAKLLDLHRRQPKTVLGMLTRGVDSQGAANRNMANHRATLQQQLEGIARDNKSYSGKVIRTNDLTALGDLGPDTRAALDTVKDAGRILDDEIEKRILKTLGQEPGDRVKKLHDELLELQSRQGHTFDDAEYRRLDSLIRYKRVALTDEKVQLASGKKARAKARSSITHEVLAEVRPMGGKGTDYRVPYGDKNRLRERMLEAESKYPAEWNSLNEMMHGEVELEQVARGYNSGGTKIALSGSEHVATHELGHSMERAVPGLRGMEWAYHYDRAATRPFLDDNGPRSLSAPESIYPGTSNAGETGNHDKWPEKYTGKVYGNPDRVDRSWEVFTTGMESLVDGSPYFNQLGGGVDVDFRRWVLGVLSVL